MNTVKSFWLGWGSLCVAGAGAYFFAKKSINADRAQRFEEAQRKKRMIDSLEYPTKTTSSSSFTTPSSSNGGSNGAPANNDFTGSPSQEASSDPAPTRHAPTTEDQRVFEKSKYESSTPFRSPKGDRFS